MVPMKLTTLPMTYGLSYRCSEKSTIILITNLKLSLEDWYAEAAEQLGISMGRFGTAQEFANIATFLASDAGSYINGTAINVDGGLCPVA